MGVQEPMAGVAMMLPKAVILVCINSVFLTKSQPYKWPNDFFARQDTNEELSHLTILHSLCFIEILNKWGHPFGEEGHSEHKNPMRGSRGSVWCRWSFNADTMGQFSGHGSQVGRCSIFFGAVFFCFFPQLMVKTISNCGGVASHFITSVDPIDHLHHIDIYTHMSVVVVECMNRQMKLTECWVQIMHSSYLIQEHAFRMTSHSSLASQQVWRNGRWSSSSIAGNLRKVSSAKIHLLILS